MSQRLVYLCVYLYVCVTVTHGLGVTRREVKQKTQDVLAGVSTPARPVPGTHCLVKGILLFEGAVWSPDECKVCECRNGAALCQGESCLNTDTPTSSPVVRQQKQVNGAKLKKPSRQKNVNPQATPSPLKAKNTPSASKKQVSPPPASPKKKPEAGLKLDWNTKIPPATQTLPGEPRFDFDDSDDDDYVDDDGDSDDDDDGTLSNYSHATIIFPDTVAAVPARKSKSLPTKKPSTPRTRQPFALPMGRSRGGKVGAVGHPVIRQSARMASLPAGCLLSDSLIACGNTGLTSLPQIKDPGVRTLYLSDNKISKIPMRVLQGMPNLEWLDLSKNKLDDASLGPGVFRQAALEAKKGQMLDDVANKHTSSRHNLTKLRRLNLDGNNLTKIPGLPPSLLELKINDNRLSGLTPHSFKGLSQLLTLEMEDNHFHDGNVSPLAFKPLRKLIYLRLDDNDFRAIPSGLPVSLKELHLSDNRIEVVHAGLLNKTVNLRVLNLSQNKLREDRIAPRAWIHLRKLETLDLSQNKLVHVPSFLPVGLQQLTLHHNQIERIPGYVFAHMKPGLASIHLSYNRLREDGINEVSFLGLHQSLNELLLDHNQLRAIPRGIIRLRALQVLRLNHNYISSIPINALCDITAHEDSPLISVHLQNNLIDRRSVPPTALTCIKEYSSVILHPQRHENVYE